MSAVTSIGGLLPKDLLDRVVSGDSTLSGTGPEQYELARGERLNDAITRSWNRLVGLWERFVAEEAALPDSERAATGLTRQRFTMPLIQELGFVELTASPGLRVEGKDYAISHEWAGSVPIHLVGARVAIDKRTPGVSGAAQTSPHGLVQEFLNRSDAHLWAIVCNGRFLRILRDNASLTRQAYVEFDLSAMFDGEQYSDFVVLWLTCHRTRFVGDRPESCLLEKWSHEATTAGTRALDRLRDGVEEAIRSLGEGFLAQPNLDLKRRLRSKELTRAEYLRQILRVIYRILFLLVAESRGLLLSPDASEESRAHYQRFYSVGRLRRLAIERRGSPHTDLWAGFMVVVRALSVKEGAPQLGLSPLGSFLWSEQSARDIDTAVIDNRHFLDAIRSLTLVRDSGSRVDRAVDYRNLGAEELGSIYEALLELHATVNVDAGTFALGVMAGHERRTTGSYYTPTSLIVELLDSALDPVIDEAARSPNPESALLSLRVLDPACGSGHFLIAAANRIAHRLAAVRCGENEPSPSQIRHALRDVVGRCIYGIDVNPMAVELCKVSLWMEALESGLPLSFLEHRIACGNALLGTTPRLISEGIPDVAYKPFDGDDRDVANSLRRANKEERTGQRTLGLFAIDVHDLVEPLASGVDGIDSLPDHNLSDLLEKEQRYEELTDSEELRRAKASADAWCSAFVIDKRKGVPPITTDIVRRIATREGAAARDAVELAESTAEQFGFLHPHVAFPEVFQVPADLADAENLETGWSGGFDVVLGNPPWEVLQMPEKEWFAGRAPEIAGAENQAARHRMIAALREHPLGSPEHSLALSWDTAVRNQAAIRRLISKGGRYPGTAVGKLNTFALFTEAGLNAVSPEGRVGLVVLDKLAVGATYADFFARLVSDRRLACFYSFENEGRIFADVHHMTKFALVVLTGAAAPVDEIAFTGYVRQASEIHQPDRRYTLTAEEIAAINPNTRTAPLFRHALDAEVTARIHSRAPVMVHDENPDGNPWGISFLQMFNMASASSLFQTKTQAAEFDGTLCGAAFEFPNGSRLLPLYEGKMIWHYDHRYGTYEGQTQQQANLGVLPRVSSKQHADPHFSILHRYWLPETLVDKALNGRWDRNWMIGFRDVGPSERTMVCAPLPRSAANHKTPLLFSTASSEDYAFLLAALSSLPVDYALRQKSASGMGLFIVKQAPMLRPPGHTGCCPWQGELLSDFVLPRTIELSVTTWDLASMADDCGFPGPPFIWDSDRRSALQAELDALFFHVYGLDRSDTEWVIDSFTVLQNNENRDPDRGGYGEFRTKRLVLEFYDLMAEAIAAGRPYESPINPPPADDAQRHPA